MSRVQDLDLEFEGDDFTYSLEFTDSSGTVIDISNWVVWFTIKENSNDSDADAVVQKEVTSHTDPTNGKTEVTVSSSDLDDKPGRYWYDFQYKDDSDNIVTFLWGKINIKQGITDTTSTS